VSILASSFRRSPTTWFVVLEWLRAQKRFHEECLFIPSEEIPGVCEPSDRAGNLEFDWQPGSPATTRFDRLRHPLEALATDVHSGLAAGPG